MIGFVVYFVPINTSPLQHEASINNNETTFGSDYMLRFAPIPYGGHRRW